MQHTRRAQEPANGTLSRRAAQASHLGSTERPNLAKLGQGHVRTPRLPQPFSKLKAFQSKKPRSGGKLSSASALPTERPPPRPHQAQQDTWTPTSTGPSADASSQPAQAQPGTWASPSTARHLPHSSLPDPATWPPAAQAPCSQQRPDQCPPPVSSPSRPIRPQPSPHAPRIGGSQTAAPGGARSVVSPSENLLETTHVLSRNRNEAICKVLGDPGPHIKDHQGPCA